MPWLVVLGEGSWHSGADGQLYRSGKHEVSEQTAERARAAERPSLLVFDSEPGVSEPEERSGPLTYRDVYGHDLRDAPSVPGPEEVDDDDAPTYDFGCRACGQTFPSSGALARHVSFHHTAFTSP